MFKSLQASELLQGILEPIKTGMFSSAIIYNSLISIHGIVTIGSFIIKVAINTFNFTYRSFFAVYLELIDNIRLWALSALLYFKLLGFFSDNV